MVLIYAMQHNATQCNTIHPWPVYLGDQVGLGLSQTQAGFDPNVGIDVYRKNGQQEVS